MFAETRAAARRTALVLAAASLAAVPAAAASPRILPAEPGPRAATLAEPAHTRSLTIRYRAHTGRERLAVVLLPGWYGPAHHPAIPLVVSPHGRGGDGSGNSRLWGDLPGLGGFAVVSPDGDGDRLGRFSWGAPGQVDDLARMPRLVEAALPWLHVDPARVFAVGGSMGGQESLLLLARYPRLLAGVAAFDSTVDLAYQYRQFPRLGCNAACRARVGSFGASLQGLARVEVGGSPEDAPAAYAARSPLTFAAAIAASCVPLELWWSTRDRIVVDGSRQSGRLLAEVRRLNPAAPVDAVEGTWVHSAEMRATTRLPAVLARLGLLAPRFGGAWGVDGATVAPAPEHACARAGAPSEGVPR